MTLAAPTGADPFGHKRPQKATTMQTTTLSPIDLFTPTADVVTRTLQPQGRAVATAATLLELALAARPDMRLDPKVLRAAYIHLSTPRTGDTPPVAARRATCLEIAAAITTAHGIGSHIRPHMEALGGVLQWWASAELLPGDDARSAAIRDTAARERRELDLAINGPSIPEIIEAAAHEHATARAQGAEYAYLNIGIDTLHSDREGGQRGRDALAALRAEGYVVNLDGRSGMIEITVAEHAARPAARRARPAVDPAVAAELALEAIDSKLALEAIDSMARELRQEPANLTRRQALEANLHTALDRLHIETTGAIVDVITAALGLSMSEAAVVADLLISVKPALARACGVPAF